jgi:hypothetical protein
MSFLRIVSSTTAGFASFCVSSAAFRSVTLVAASPANRPVCTRPSVVTTAYTV